MLGGVQGVATVVLDHDLTMRFNLCAPYKFTPPIEGQRKQSAKVVFKVSDDGTVSFVGVAPVTYVFDLLADFHFCAPESLKFGETSTPQDMHHEMSGLTAIPEILYCPPPYFTKKVLVEHYDFEDNAYAPVLAKKLEQDGQDYDINKPMPLHLPKKVRVPSTHVPCHVVRTYDGEVPTEPPAGLREFEDKSERECCEYVRQLFQRRPIWLRASLEANLPPGTQILSWTFNRVLQHVAYLWQDGPFRQCYVRLGYDPRKDISSMVYQVIDFRDPDLRELKAKKMTARSSKDIQQKTNQAYRLAEVQFTTPPTQQSQLYQITDIQDAAIQEMFTQYVPDGSFDMLQGYITSDIFTKIRNAMKVKSAMMRSLQKNSSLALTSGDVSWAKD